MSPSLQPRRISAMGVAERVASERGEPIGSTVGYTIRLESKVSVPCNALRKFAARVLYLVASPSAA